MKKQTAILLTISSMLLTGSSLAYAAEAAPIQGSKIVLNAQGHSVNTAGGIQGSKTEVNNQGDKLIVSSGIQGSKVVVNGQGDKVNTAGGVNSLKFQTVRNKAGVDLAPVRVIAESLGYSVNWDARLHQINITGKDVSALWKMETDFTLIGNKAYVSIALLQDTLKTSFKKETDGSIIIGN
jgi:hypothetical protein